MRQNPHVRICGGPGSATTLVYPTAVGCGAPASEPGTPLGELDTASATEAPVDPTAVRPFTIAVPDAVLEDLQMRLDHAGLPDQLDDVGWDYGAELGYVSDLIRYWRDGFDWRADMEACTIDSL